MTHACDLAFFFSFLSFSSTRSNRRPEGVIARCQFVDARTSGGRTTVNSRSVESANYTVRFTAGNGTRSRNGNFESKSFSGAKRGKVHEGIFVDEKQMEQNEGMC